MVELCRHGVSVMCTKQECLWEFQEACRRLADCLKLECGAAYAVCLFCAVVVLWTQDAPFKAAREAFHVVHEICAGVDKCIFVVRRVVYQTEVDGARHLWRSCARGGRREVLQVRCD